jgi:hypothetical protein
MNFDLEKSHGPQANPGPATPFPLSPSLAKNETQNPTAASPSPMIQLINILSKDFGDAQDDDILGRLKTLAVTGPQPGETPPSIHSDSEKADLDNAAKLLRVLRAFAYPPDQISFKGFRLLNLFSLLLYEHELLAFHVDFTAHPESLLCGEKVSKMRSLLKEYSTSP